MAVAMIWYDYQQSRDNFVHSAMATARANALEIDKELAMVESALVALATSPGLAANDLRAFDARVSAATNSPWCCAARARRKRRTWWTSSASSWPSPMW
jgi:hypothetical protein